jgi:hypothetical protein
MIDIERALESHKHRMLKPRCIHITILGDDYVYGRLILAFKT